MSRPFGVALLMAGWDDQMILRTTAAPHSEKIAKPYMIMRTSSVKCL